MKALNSHYKGTIIALLDACSLQLHEQWPQVEVPQMQNYHLIVGRFQVHKEEQQDVKEKGELC
jgi:hypothetical protein